jgi:hypothetical protein
MERDAKRIIAASHEAPFGRGEQTIVDPTVRKTWELNANQVVIQNEAFWSYMKSALHSCMAGLGIEGSHQISAQFYKLLLYEEGAHFRPHTE